MKHYDTYHAYDDFKLKKCWSPWFIQKYFSALRVKNFNLKKNYVIFVLTIGFFNLKSS